MYSVDKTVLNEIIIVLSVVPTLNVKERYRARLVRLVFTAARLAVISFWPAESVTGSNQFDGVWIHQESVQTEPTRPLQIAVTVARTRLGGPDRLYVRAAGSDRAAGRSRYGSGPRGRHSTFARQFASKSTTYSTFIFKVKDSNRLIGGPHENCLR